MLSEDDLSTLVGLNTGSSESQPTGSASFKLLPWLPDTVYSQVMELTRLSMFSDLVARLKADAVSWKKWYVLRVWVFGSVYMCMEVCECMHWMQM